MEIEGGAFTNPFLSFEHVIITFINMTRVGRQRELLYSKFCWPFHNISLRY